MKDKSILKDSYAAAYGYRHSEQVLDRSGDKLAWKKISTILLITGETEM